MTFLSALFRRHGPVAVAPPLSPFEVALATLARCTSAPDIIPFASHYNGYVRQAAIAHCADLNTPAMLPIVASRLNDWVGQVRDAARAAVMTLAPVSSASALLAILPDVEHLQRARRSDHAAWIATYHALLASRLTANDAEAGIGSPVRAVARASFQLARRCQLIDQERLIALALAQRNDILLAQGALALIQELPPALRRKWFEQLTGSHFLLLRLAALRALLTLDPDGADLRAIATLSDRMTSMRDVAIAHLDKRGFDVRDVYRQLLLAPATPARLVCIALTTLAGLRALADLALIQTFIQAKQPAIRLAALAAWLRLVPASKDEIALLALRDATPALRRFAWNIVRRQHAYIPFDEVYAILMPLRDYRRMIQFAQTHQWQWLATLLEIARDPGCDPDTVAILRESALNWCRQAGRHYAAPAPDLAALFALPESQRTLDALGIPALWLHPL
jgi:hypothetical protein